MSAGEAPSATRAPGAMRVERATGPLRGRVRVPGSKSVSTRAIVLAALAPQPVLLRDVLMADDTERLLSAVSSMGVSAARLFGGDWRIDGGAWRDGTDEIAVHLGDGGAPTRFTMALAALRAGATVIDGSARMRERPVEDGVRLLRALGVRVDAVEREGCLPIRVHGAFGATSGSAGTPSRAANVGVGGASAPRGDAGPLEIEVGRTASSQFVSALLLVAPALPAGLRVRFVDAPTSASYLALTIEALRAFGARVEVDSASASDGVPARGSAITVHSGLRGAGANDASSAASARPATVPPSAFEVPADASSAVVWAAAAAMVPGSRIELEGIVRDAQPDVRAIEALGQMGAKLEWRRDGLVVEHAGLRGVDVDAEAWPDGALAVAAAATAANGATRLRSLGTLRVKESDRLAALAHEFGRLGIEVRVDGDDLVVEPRSMSNAAPRAIDVDTHRDHRIAMSLALVGLARGGVVVHDPGCVGKSYPGFWRHLDALAPRAAIAV